MTWFKEKLVWIAGVFVALVSFYLIGRKDGKNAEKSKTAQNALKMVKDKNIINSRVNSTPADKLRYRD